jgi:hypothetical protein
MTGPIRSRSPSSPDDQSSVRERTPVPSSATSVAPPPPGAQPTTPRARLEQKLVLARSVLAKLPGTDDRARLLHIAVLRRDESLLDGVLASLGVDPHQG